MPTADLCSVADLLFAALSPGGFLWHAATKEEQGGRRAPDWPVAKETLDCAIIDRMFPTSSPLPLLGAVG